MRNKSSRVSSSKGVPTEQVQTARPLSHPQAPIKATRARQNKAIGTHSSQSTRKVPHITLFLSRVVLFGHVYTILSNLEHAGEKRDLSAFKQGPQLALAPQGNILQHSKVSQYWPIAEVAATSSKERPLQNRHRGKNRSTIGCHTIHKEMGVASH